ncbi:hypothetical protein A1Q1_03957 [Trichosporon asahii var. asahii CBS 2479]|uniref:Uncharacterized protein n=1 Tax=Trichosporon asahii var. asahii (strain ATCC 90039 / CBS 2479 / JCM 2466 / KCTC 7840 / NBRC 103889/ NCYC 2677 / UAMH 7654) TaxID=1186058 RepID=J5TRY6_TRIAS|nr:hypothetical protein A1Q1_03957 [Trichosporon asahii var. asahii CBS 2479]EJT52441.1 hypothetical protein A1Q1_03957 [Trichosporon asahii var. asahii CBS 2479]
MWCSCALAHRALDAGVDDDWKAMQTAPQPRAQGVDPEKMCNHRPFRSCRAWRTSVDGDQDWATAQHTRITLTGRSTIPPLSPTLTIETQERQEQGLATAQHLRR